MRARWWIVGAIVIAALGAMLALRRKPVPLAPAKQDAAVVDLSGEVTIQGKVRPEHVVSVAAGVPGFIEAFLAEPGDQVYEGQVLARVGAQNLETDRESAASAVEQAEERAGRAQAALATAKLELSRAEADAARSKLNLDRVEKVFTRQQYLYEQGATPRLNYERALADYEEARRDFGIMDNAARTAREAAQAAERDVAAARKIADDKRSALERAQEDLAASEVHSPVDGLVVGREGEVGKSAEEIGDRLFTIATDLYALQVVLEPKPEVLKRIIPGMPVTVNILDIDNAAFEGTVKSINDKDRQVVVEFACNNPAVKPGLIGGVRFKFQ
ncbi:MAG: HlyD family efflux transporter periplasmic adaptor subunit [Acidobacteria bacterium]|nr:HlyD family efflux transporter periplasmic adaptor subunit [Acidobacteriota bacterium]